MTTLLERSSPSSSYQSETAQNRTFGQEITLDKPFLVTHFVVRGVSSPNNCNIVARIYKKSDGTLLASSPTFAQTGTSDVSVALSSAVTLQANTGYVLAITKTSAAGVNFQVPTKSGGGISSVDGVTMNYVGSSLYYDNVGMPYVTYLASTILVFGLTGTIANLAPTLTITNPANNQVLSEGSGSNTLSVSGSATDVDSGNVVTVKYKINNGPTKALQSGVSNGSTPISFAKNLTYHDKRLWDGSTDVTGADLAENTQHTLTVWDEDDQGGVSNLVTRTFTVIWNRPPVISGSDSNLGTISAIPTVNYSVTELESDSFTITEYLNGQQTRSFAGAAGQNYSATIDPNTWLTLALDVPHEIRIRATDSKGLYSERVFTFIRTETEIQFELNLDDPDTRDFFTCDAKPTRILVTLDAVIPSGASITKVEVCNNAFDAVPTWEDATGPAKAVRGYLFTNNVKTAANWGINIRVTIDKGTATERVILNGFGGAFD